MAPLCTISKDFFQHRFFIDEEEIVKPMYNRLATRGKEVRKGYGTVSK